MCLPTLATDLTLAALSGFGSFAPWRAAGGEPAACLADLCRAHKRAQGLLAARDVLGQPVQIRRSFMAACAAEAPTHCRRPLGAPPREFITTAPSFLRGPPLRDTISSVATVLHSSVTAQAKNGFVECQPAAA